MFRKDETSSLSGFFALEHTVYVGFPPWCAPASQPLHVPPAAWRPLLHSCKNIKENSLSFAGELTGSSSSQIKLENWMLFDSKVPVWVSHTHPGQSSLVALPTLEDSPQGEENQWGTAALCQDLDSWVLGCFHSFFWRKTDIFQWGSILFSLQNVFLLKSKQK